MLPYKYLTVQPGFENILNFQKELFDLRLELAKEEKTDPWVMEDLNDAIKSLKQENVETRRVLSEKSLWMILWEKI